MNQGCQTDIFAPGSGISSSGIDGPQGESVETGTAQAAAFTAGTVLLMQQYFMDRKESSRQSTTSNGGSGAAAAESLMATTRWTTSSTGLAVPSIDPYKTLAIIRDELGDSPPKRKPFIR